MKKRCRRFVPLYQIQVVIRAFHVGSALQIAFQAFMTPLDIASAKKISKSLCISFFSLIFLFRFPSTYSPCFAFCSLKRKVGLLIPPRHQDSAA